MPPEAANPDAVNSLLYVLFGAGGTGAIGLLLKFVTDWRNGRVESAKTLAARIEATSVRDAKRAEEAEAAEEQRRVERDQALDQAALYRRTLIEHGIALPEVPT